MLFFCVLFYFLFFFICFSFVFYIVYVVFYVFFMFSKLSHDFCSLPFSAFCVGCNRWTLAGCSLARHCPRSLQLVATTTSKARRAQRQRQSDRALTTLARATTRLRRHHGSAAPATMAPPTTTTHWECRKCKTWAPRGGKPYCEACGHSPPAGVTDKRSTQVQGAGGRSNRQPAAPRAPQAKSWAPPPSTIAVAEPGWALATTKRGKRQQLKAARAIAEAAGMVVMDKEQAPAATVSPAGNAGDCDMDTAEAPGSTTSDLEVEIKSLQRKFDALSAMDEDAWSSAFDSKASYEQRLTMLKDTLAKLRVQKCGLLPMAEQLKRADAAVERAAKRIETTQKRQEAAKEALAKAMEAETLASAEVANAQALHEEARRRRSELAQQLATETCPAAPAPVQPAQGSAPPGFVSVADAEKILAEQLALREAAYREQIAHLGSAQADAEADELESVPDSNAGSTTATGDGDKKRHRASGLKLAMRRVQARQFEKVKWAER